MYLIYISTEKDSKITTSSQGFGAAKKRMLLDFRHCKPFLGMNKNVQCKLCYFDKINSAITHTVLKCRWDRDEPVAHALHSNNLERGLKKLTRPSERTKCKYIKYCYLAHFFFWESQQKAALFFFLKKKCLVEN